MKILVTGATGFIGNYVISELLKLYYHIIATSTDIDKAKNFFWYSMIDYIPFDISTQTNINLMEYFNFPDLVIHLAWSNLPNYNDEIHTNVNLPNQILFLDNLIHNGLKNLTVTGTCFEYGFVEGKLIEEMESFPTTQYGIAKNKLRVHLEQYIKDKHSISLKWSRLFYMYGIGQNNKSLFSQLYRALESGDTIFNMSGGEQIRDFLHVEKVAENIVKISLQSKVNGIINNCSGSPIKVKDFVLNYLQDKQKKIELNLGFYPYTDYEPMIFWGCNKKLNSIIS